MFKLFSVPTCSWDHSYCKWISTLRNYFWTGFYPSVYSLFTGPSTVLHLILSLTLSPPLCLSLHFLHWELLATTGGVVVPRPGSLAMWPTAHFLSRLWFCFTGSQWTPWEPPFQKAACFQFFLFFFVFVSHTHKKYNLGCNFVVRRDMKEEAGLIAGCCHSLTVEKHIDWLNQWQSSTACRLLFKTPCWFIVSRKVRTRDEKLSRCEVGSME